MADKKTYAKNLIFLSEIYIRQQVNWDYINCIMCLPGAAAVAFVWPCLMKEVSEHLQKKVETKWH